MALAASGKPWADTETVMFGQAAAAVEEMGKRTRKPRRLVAVAAG